ncbi:MAG TPA: LamG domain-containing protein, partial [Nodosilinea sp.]|nr:LamG domain-containing protein [Nodosilinea sp.]
MTSLTQKFVKTYSPANQGKFKYTTMVSHKGTLIAFALDDQRRIYYTALEMDRADVDSPLDVDFWNLEPDQLRFPTELSSVGYSAAGVRQMPSVILKGTEGLGEEIDQFLSTTAQLTADAPFQVVSDNQHIYVFRQAAAHDAEGNVVKDSNQGSLEFVDQTLLLDRFVYVSGKLKNKLEVRYQRSRHKDLPASRKDALGHADLEKKEFYEPTQQLSFIRNMQEGRFSVLLIPTAVPDVQRWQIFAYNAATQRMDSFNIERSADGLFNTRGTRYYTSPAPVHQNDVFERNPGECPFTSEPLIPIVSRDGFAESALALNGTDEFVQVASMPLAHDQPLTLEAWVQVDASAQGPLPLLAHSHCQIDYLSGQSTLKISRWDGSHNLQSSYPTPLEDGQFHHLALVLTAKTQALYFDGQAVAPSGTVSTPSRTPLSNSSDLNLGSDSQQNSFFKGVIDEFRVWERARSPQGLTEDMNHRLVGNEPGLAGYWRFDEGAGTTIYDQTDNARHGKFFTSHTASADIASSWVKSQAPVGEHPGVRRSSFSFADRTITAGCAALLYHQQENAATGYNPEEQKPLKRSARVMFAVPTMANNDPKDTQNLITTLDFAVNREGNLAQVPDSLQLKALANTSLNDSLDHFSFLQSEVARLISEIQSADNEIEEIDAALYTAPLCTAVFKWGEYWWLFSGRESLEVKISRTGDALDAWIEQKAPGIKVKTTTAILPGIDAVGNTRFFEERPAVDAIAFNVIDRISSVEPQEFYHIFRGKNCLKYKITGGGERGLTASNSINPITHIFTPDGEGRLGSWKRKIEERTAENDLNGYYDLNWHKWYQQVEAEGIDAAITLNDHEMYLFKGKLCALVEPFTRPREESYDLKIASIKLISEYPVFSAFPLDWLNDDDGLDAVYFDRSNDHNNDNRLLFFKGAEYVRLFRHVKSDSVAVPQAYKPHDPNLSIWEHDLFSKLNAFKEAVNVELVTRKNLLLENISRLSKTLQDTQKEVEKLDLVRQSQFGTDMPFLLADPTGLTVSGGILGFAETIHAPCLFETVNGRVSLYFKGQTTSAQENHFLTAYYNVLAGRATYGLPKEHHQVELIARSTGAAFDDCEIAVSGEDEATCTVTLKSPGLDIEETWHQVPRHPQQFADVLNGAAQPTYVGKVTQRSTTGGSTRLSLEGRGQQTVAIGDVLLVGSQKTQARVARVLPPFRGAALVLDGKDDYIQLGAVETILPQGTASGSSLSVAESFTAEAWVWVDEAALSQDNPVLGMDERAENKSLHLTIRQGKPHFGFFGGTNDLTSDSQLLPQTWYHIAWRYTRETGEQAIFINGRLDKTAVGRAPFTGRGPLYIGRWSSNPQRYFKGMIGEVRLWSEARPEADIQANLTSYLTGQDSGTNTLVGCWRFGQSPQGGTTARDYSARNRPCTVQGQPRLKQVQEKATQVEVAAAEIGSGTSVNLGDSVYRLTYDYDANASTNKVARSLSQGSLLFNVNSVTSQGAILNGTASTGQKGLSGQWFTDTYGSALNFDKPTPGSAGQTANAVGLLQNPSDPKATVGKFSTDADLTLEAWVKHVAFPRGTTRLIHHSSVDPNDPKAGSYTMGLRSYGLRQGQAGNSTSLYQLFVGVGDTFVQTAPIIQPVQWHHLAASFNQSYGLEFKRDRDQVDCGNDITLDLTDDLTIEATIRLADLETPRGILTKGQIDDGTDQDCPYALYINTEGRLVLAFEDKNHGNVFLTSPEDFGTFEVNKTYRIGVTRKKTTETSGSGANFTIKQLTDVYFFKQLPGTNPTYTKLNQSYTGTIGSSNGKLLIGQAYAKPTGSGWQGGTCHFRGEISEVRLWNTALPQQELGQPLKGREKGLVAWWQF